MHALHGLFAALLGLVMLSVLMTATIGVCDGDPEQQQAAARPAPRFLILSLINGAFMDRWGASLAAKNVYAARHGYAHIIESPPSAANFAEIMWIKPLSIQKYLKYYDWVFFVDGDTYIVNQTIPLTVFATPDAHVVIGDEDGPPFLAGILMVRNSPQGEQFLQRWLGMTRLIPGENWLDYDNGAMIHTVLTFVVPGNEDGHVCLVEVKKRSYIEYSRCVFRYVRRHAGFFGRRKNAVIRFLPPDITWGKFCDEDMAYRKQAEWYAPQLRWYRYYKEGDFMVHAKKEKLPTRFLPKS